MRKIREIKAAKRAVRDNWQLLEEYDNLANAKRNVVNAMDRIGKIENLVREVPGEYAHFKGLYKDVQTVNLGFATAFAKTFIKEAKKVVAALSEKTVELALKHSAFTIAQRIMQGIGAAMGAGTVVMVIVVDASPFYRLVMAGAGISLSMVSPAIGAVIKIFGDALSKYYWAAEIYKEAKEDAAKDKGPVDFTES